ncbi:MAG: hypothetical protein K2K82_09625 [Muribaculaceae bacterium]|nr:hypothetical protein [Muribaculaceae bacterium]
MLKEEIIDLLARKAGRDVRIPAGSDWLQKDILTVTGENLSLQTVKRMTGVLQSETIPSRTSLDIVARYLGFEDYPAVERALIRGVSDFKRDEGLVEVDLLPADTRLELRWSPDRRIVLRRLPSGECRVEEAENSKLRVGDRLTISQLTQGYPLNVREVVRDGRALGPYTAAPEYGLTFVRIL